MREKETLRIELTKNGVRERKREQEKSKREDKEATDHNQCSIERTKSFSETETKKSRQEATGNCQQKLVHPTRYLKLFSKTWTQAQVG